MTEYELDILVQKMQFYCFLNLVLIYISVIFPVWQSYTIPEAFQIISFLKLQKYLLLKLKSQSRVQLLKTQCSEVFFVCVPSDLQSSV